MVSGVFLDIRKAADTVNHLNLLSKVEISGIKKFLSQKWKDSLHLTLKLTRIYAKFSQISKYLQNINLLPNLLKTKYI